MPAGYLALHPWRRRIRACSPSGALDFCRHRPVGYRPDGYSTVGLDVMLCDYLSMETLRSIEVGARSRKSSAGWTASQPTITDDNRQQRIYRTWRGWVRTFYGTTALRAVSGAPGPRFADVRSGQEGGGCLQGHGSRSCERRFQAECARGVPAHDPGGEVRPRGDQLDRLARPGGRGARRQTGPARSLPDGAGAVAPRARRNRGPAPGQRNPAQEDAGLVPAEPDGSELGGVHAAPVGRNLLRIQGAGRPPESVALRAADASDQ